LISLIHFEPIQKSCLSLWERENSAASIHGYTTTTSWNTRQPQTRLKFSNPFVVADPTVQPEQRLKVGLKEGVTLYDLILRELYSPKLAPCDKLGFNVVATI